MRPPLHKRNANVKRTLRTGNKKMSLSSMMSMFQTSLRKQITMLNARNRLYRVFDEEEDEDEAENKNPWEVDDGVGDEDEVDDENEVDDEDDWN
ncbi:hypothetical protein Tco_0429663 [Tanacetum coccineum]